MLLLFCFRLRNMPEGACASAPYATNARILSQTRRAGSYYLRSDMRRIGSAAYRGTTSESALRGDPEVGGLRTAERRIGASESKRLTNAFGFAYNVNEKHIRQEYPAGNGQREGSAAESPLRGMREKCGRTAPRRKCRGGRRRYTHTRGGLLSAIKVGPR